MSLFEKHKDALQNSIEALKTRAYFTLYPENPKAYPEEKLQEAKNWFSNAMNNNFSVLNQEGSQGWIGEEISPFTQTGIGIKYPQFSVQAAVNLVLSAQTKWQQTSIEERAGLLLEALENVKERFFDIAIATMHTTGQSFMMSFQASGPHANDRALEAIAMGYAELTRYNHHVKWTKNLGKFDLVIDKDFTPMPKGVGLVIGCSTFPVWNTVPGLFANLISGNACIVKPHAKSVLPIAIVIEELQKVLTNNGFDANTVLMFTDSINEPKTKELAEKNHVKLIDYTGNSEFGNYIESLPKTTFTEKAGVNSIIIDSVKDLKAVCGNIAFSASLYSGQMCTAPQNIFVSSMGINSPEGNLSYENVKDAIVEAFKGLIDNPKAGPGTIGSIQNDNTYKRVKDATNLGGNILLESKTISNEEFPDARIATPVVIELSRDNVNTFGNECFGPIVFIIKTNDTNDSIALAKALAEEKGALTCGAYTTDETVMNNIKQAMNSIFVPVSFNFTGAGFINSHAAFSDFHLTGGNKAGNASFTNADFINRRIVWVGNRYM
ncbi:MAG: phenylacetic acid degradation protein PaaN [Bacteroidia bacterium]